MLSVSLALALLLMQYAPYGGRRMPPGAQGVPGIQGANTDAVATFEGKFKSADKKYLTIEVEQGQTMRMYITGATKYFRDDKPAKASEFKPDEKVSSTPPATPASTCSLSASPP